MTYFQLTKTNSEYIIMCSPQGENQDLGMSLSDGLYDCGVYISAVASGGMAMKAGLRVYDRLLQVCI